MRRELDSRLAVLIAHLLKWQLQPDRAGASWRRTLEEQRRSIRSLLERHPSLSGDTRSRIDDIYARASRSAARDMLLFEDAMPPRCPYTVDQILDPGYVPFSHES